jgi:hypothetical protein
VAPFVALTPPEYHILSEVAIPKALTLNHEVAAAFWVPVSFLKKSGRSEIFRFMIDGQEREWASYPTAEGPIWGMTERIITSFLSFYEN